MSGDDIFDEAPTALRTRPESPTRPPPPRPRRSRTRTAEARTVDVLTADEVAEILRVDRKTVYDTAGRGEMPHRRLGKRLVFSRAALLDKLACKPASKE